MTDPRHQDASVVSEGVEAQSAQAETTPATDVTVIGGVSSITLKEDDEKFLASLMASLLEKYDQVVPIGVGASSLVLRVHSSAFMDTVRALKVSRAPYNPKSSKDGGDSAKAEANTLERLADHPNIARVHSNRPFTTDTGVQHLAMETALYPSDFTKVKRRFDDPSYYNDVAKWMKQVASALDYAYKEDGVIHRDIKPANIFFGAKGVNCKDAILGDFGLHKIGDTGSNLFNGTPAYASPEQARGEEATDKSDIYSLGVVMYELLTGESPYGKQTYVNELLKIVGNEDIKNPIARETNPEVPPELSDICAKALNKAPNQRYQSAGEMQEDLEKFLAPSPNHAPVSIPAAAANLSKRGFLGVGAMALTVAVAGAGAAILLQRASNREIDTYTSFKGFRNSKGVDGIANYNLFEKLKPLFEAINPKTVGETVWVGDKVLPQTLDTFILSAELFMSSIKEHEHNNWEGVNDVQGCFYPHEASLASLRTVLSVALDENGIPPDIIDLDDAEHVKKVTDAKNKVFEGMTPTEKGKLIVNMRECQVILEENQRYLNQAQLRVAPVHSR